MKQKIKEQLSELGLLPHIDLLRRVPEILHWIAAGCTGAAPPPLKRLIISAYLRRSRLSRR